MYPGARDGVIYVPAYPGLTILPLQFCPVLGQVYDHALLATMIPWEYSSLFVFGILGVRLKWAAPYACWWKKSSTALYPRSYSFLTSASSRFDRAAIQPWI